VVPTIEQIVSDMRKETRFSVLKIVKRTDSKTIEELLDIICPAPARGVHPRNDRRWIDQNR